MKSLLARLALTVIVISTASGAIYGAAHQLVPKKKVQRRISKYAPLPILRPNQFFKDRSGSVFKLTDEKGTSGGTAFSAISSNGHIYLLSNQHVCEGAVEGQMYAKRDNGQSFKVKVIKFSSTDDICALTSVPGSAPLTLASSWHVSQYVMVLGHPHLNPLAVSAGILLGTGQGRTTEKVKPEDKCGRFDKRTKVYTPFWGTEEFCERENLFTLYSTAPAFSGNSGSPVLDMDGNVVGIVYAVDTRTTESSMVPLSVVKAFLDNLPL